jgi:hypothetical protein
MLTQKRRARSGDPKKNSFAQVLPVFVYGIASGFRLRNRFGKFLNFEFLLATTGIEPSTQHKQTQALTT